MTSQGTGQIATRVGANIRTARAAKGLTQRELADAIGSDPMFISKWERGRHRPSDSNLELLARALGRDLAWFYTDPEDQAA